MSMMTMYVANHTNKVGISGDCVIYTADTSIIIPLEANLQQSSYPTNEAGFKQSI